MTGLHTFDSAALVPTVAHGGQGEIAAARVIDRGANPGLVFVDLVVVPPETSIGLHTHGPDDEELYVVVDGHGEMEVDGEVVEVGPGSVVVNRPGGRHGLRNTGPEPVRLVVVDVGVGGRGPAEVPHPGQRDD